jgi:hypothetical protein
MSRPAYDTRARLPVQPTSRLFDLWESEIVPQLDEQARALKAAQRYRAIGRASNLLEQ